MDNCLTLLFICLCSHVAISAEPADDRPAHPAPLVPLLPSNTSETDESQRTIAPASPPHLSILGNNGSGSDEDEVEGCGSISRSPESLQAISAAIQKLGVQLLQNLETTPEQPNLIISPLSISLALSQLALGAENETEELLMHHLHENTVPCYHKSLRNVLVHLTKNRDLQIATGIFLRQGFKAKEEFVSESQQLYNSEASILKSLQQINDWVENATQGKMTDFLSSLPSDLLLMLINAVHFKGEWKAQFDPQFTSKGVFYLDDMNMVDVEVMEDSKHPLSFIFDQELEAQVATFPFMKLMSLLVVMPLTGQVNVSSLSAKLNISDLYDRLPKETPVQVKVPKFKLEYSQELEDVLTKLGLGEIFLSPNLADIADGPLLVSSVMHKSSIEINEQGGEAAAASTVVISRASNPAFHLNHPFFFVLIDDLTQVPIFMGVINNPSPGSSVTKREDGKKDQHGFQNDKSFNDVDENLPK